MKKFELHTKNLNGIRSWAALGSRPPFFLIESQMNKWKKRKSTMLLVIE